MRLDCYYIRYILYIYSIETNKQHKMKTLNDIKQHLAKGFNTATIEIAHGDEIIVRLNDGKMAIMNSKFNNCGLRGYVEYESESKFWNAVSRYIKQQSTK